MAPEETLSLGKAPTVFGQGPRVPAQGLGLPATTPGRRRGVGVSPLLPRVGLLPHHPLTPLVLDVVPSAVLVKFQLLAYVFLLCRRVGQAQGVSPVSPLLSSR